MFKGFFILEQRNIYAWLYVPVTGHITIWHIWKENKRIRSEPQDMVLSFDVLNPKLSCPIDLSTLFSKQTLLNELTPAKLVSWWHVYTADCTCYHRKISATNRKFWENWATWNKYKHLAISNDGVKRSNASPIFCGSLLILLFFLKIRQMVICPVTGTHNQV